MSDFCRIEIIWPDGVGAGEQKIGAVKELSDSKEGF